METRITTTELAKSLSDILNRVRYKGEQFLIELDGEPVATLAPPGPSTRTTLAELAKQLGELFIPEAFADDLEYLQSTQPKVNSLPWPSL